MNKIMNLCFPNYAILLHKCTSESFPASPPLSENRATVSEATLFSMENSENLCERHKPADVQVRVLDEATMNTDNHFTLFMLAGKNQTGSTLLCMLALLLMEDRQLPLFMERMGMLMLVGPWGM